MTVKSFIIRAVTLTALAGAVVWAVMALSLGRAEAMPDPYTPIPPAYCAGGGVQTPWGGYCSGATYADGTKWNIVNGMGFWQPMQCVIADAPAPPPLAGPHGCGR